MAPVTAPDPPWLRQTSLVIVTDEVDIFVARAQAQGMAAAMGFDRYAVMEVETAVSELASNVLHHGGGGRVWIRRQGSRLAVTCFDRGPGFSGTAGRLPRGLGIGLRGAGRLMGHLEHGDRPGGGAWVHAWRDLDQEPGTFPPRASPVALPDYDIAVCWRCADGETACGDAFAAVDGPTGLVLAVIDGLGHGTGAAAAAAAVRKALSASGHPTLPAALQTADAVARGSRGAVAGVLWIQPHRAQWAGVGNVTMRALPDGRCLSGDSGCLGVRRAEVRERTIAPVPQALLLHSDGVPSQTSTDRLPLTSARRLAERAVLRSSVRDDATAIGIVHRIGGAPA